MKTLSQNRCFGGTQGVYSQASDACGVDMTFGLFLPEEAAIGVKLTNLGHKNSREALEVHGLAPGRYELSIDGTVAGEFGSEQLSRHIELQANDKTPQYQQALKVANLNRDRNSGPVKNLRNEWRLFQGYARAKRDAQTDEARAKVVEMEKRLEGLT